MFVEEITCALAVLTSVTVAVNGQPVPPSLRQPADNPFGLRGQEPYTNLTIDQIILKSMGGMSGALGLMVRDGKVLAELDMMLTEDQFYNLYELPSSKLMMGEIRKKRKATRDVARRWPKATMPYTLVRGHYDERETYWINRAMTEWERYTCMRVRPSTSGDRNVVRFQNGQGCNSDLGMTGGIQVLNLESPGCRWKGLYLHEMGHAIGLVHEHQLPNRDDYIDILYSNVEPSMRIWFNKYNKNQVNQFNVPYEYSSAMHYGITAFSKDGRSQTIRAKVRDQEEDIGKVYLKELSFSDVKVVNLMYKCAAHCPKNVWCTNGGYVDQNCECVCPDGSSDCQVTTTDNSNTNDNKDTSCRNTFKSGWRCYVWANQGECERNPDWMNENCAKACDICGSEVNTLKNKDLHLMTWSWQLMGLFSDILPKVRNIDICKDKFPEDKCAVWVKRGDCSTNPGWMRTNCKKSCNYCEETDKPETNCKNKHTDNSECDKWALEGECQLNRIWMMENCRKACRKCRIGDAPDEGEEGTTDKEEEVPCINSYNEEKCNGWARDGECVANPSWMIPNCRKACHKCEDGKCKNMHRDSTCKAWVRDGECKRRPKFMKKECNLECGFCTPETPDVTKRPVTEPSVTVRTTAKPTDGDCKNGHNDKDCKIWADAGHCSKNPSWMLANCKRSCKVCTVTTNGGGDNGGSDRDKDNGGGDSSGKNCVDSKEDCGSWAKSKYCDSNAGFMLKYCRKACKNCKANCEDQHILCPIWGNGGHCSSNAGYMLRHCQKTCKVCEA